MPVKIRLMRIGAKKRPFYRVVAIDEQKKRNGSYLELLGTYNPLTEPKEIILKKDRIEHWLKNGAVPSEGYLRIIGQAPQRPHRKAKKEKAPKAAVAPKAPEETPAPAEQPQSPDEVKEEPQVEETKAKSKETQVTETPTEVVEEAANKVEEEIPAKEEEPSNEPPKEELQQKPQ